MKKANYNGCPKCTLSKTKEKEEKDLELDAAYGNISKEDYFDLAKDASSSNEQAGNLHEVYTVHLDDKGNFNIDYTCDCDICGFEYSYEHAEDADLT